MSTYAMNSNVTTLNIISWTFGAVVVAIGLVNMFFGNDPEFGMFILVLSIAYFIPLHDLLQKYLSCTMITVGKILLGIFILWIALGVGELFDKVDMMSASFKLFAFEYFQLNQ